MLSNVSRLVFLAFIATSLLTCNRASADKPGNTAQSRRLPISKMFAAPRTHVASLPASTPARIVDASATKPGFQLLAPPAIPSRSIPITADSAVSGSMAHEPYTMPGVPMIVQRLENAYNGSSSVYETSPGSYIEDVYIEDENRMPRSNYFGVDPDCCYDEWEGFCNCDNGCKKCGRKQSKNWFGKHK